MPSPSAPADPSSSAPGLPAGFIRGRVDGGAKWSFGSSSIPVNFTQLVAVGGFELTRDFTGIPMHPAVGQALEAARMLPDHLLQDDCLCIYVDGSWMPEASTTGWAFVAAALRNQEEHLLGACWHPWVDSGLDDTCDGPGSSPAEKAALLWALRWRWSTGHRGRAVVLPDALEPVKVASGLLLPKSTLDHRLQQTWMPARPGQLAWCHVKGHSGAPGTRPPTRWPSGRRREAPRPSLGASRRPSWTAVWAGTGCPTPPPTSNALSQAGSRTPGSLAASPLLASPAGWRSPATCRRLRLRAKHSTA